METSVSAGGSVKGTQVNERLTFMAKPTSPGVLHGVGQGVLMAGESEIASYTGEVAQSGVEQFAIAHHLLVN
jgi:hypothetical protein